MYIALNQPEVPEFRASLKLTPIEPKEDMKIRKYQQKMFFSRGMCQFFTVVWFLIIAVSMGVNLTK